MTYSSPCVCVRVQKDEVYLNLVLDFIPETVYRVIRHHSKAKQIMPVLYIKVRSYMHSRALEIQYTYCQFVPTRVYVSPSPLNIRKLMVRYAHYLYTTL